MFSKQGQNGTPAGTIRTSRRRQRPASNEGSIPKAKRQRSALTENTFRPEDDTGEMEEVKPFQKIAALGRRDSQRETPIPPKEIPVRGKKQRSGERNTKGDGSIVLTTNNTYTVSKLPALPHRLRTSTTTPQHGAIYSDTGYALTLTHSHAFVWPYADTNSSPETFTFAIPETSKHNLDPLPLGSLVSASASSTEPGLVIVLPTTGKITYWESIASAATLDLRLQRNGVDFTILGMLSGEKVIQILNAESAGFMLAFSTGRIAYMTVRDGQGRPNITVQFLRSGSGASNTGLFGSLRNALSNSAWHSDDIVAVRAGRQEKVGARNVVLATKKGKIQSWDISRGGHATLVAESEGRESIVSTMKEAIPSFSGLHIETFELLDFAYIQDLPSDTAIVRRSDEDSPVNLLLLVSLADRGVSHYALVEGMLGRGGLLVEKIKPLKTYSTPVARNATSNTRIYLPDPALAFVVFDRAVVVLALARETNSPDSQLMSENHLFPDAFEDTVDFRHDMNIEIVGSGTELSHAPNNVEESKTRRNKAKHPATVVILRGGGVIRIAATDISKIQSFAAPQVTAKSKLEQAVFYGTQEHNPINFSVRSESEFSPEELGEAALELSLNILRSETPHIPSVTASIEQNLRKRASALRNLAKYLQASGVELDRKTKWKLLWDAEKMAAASVVWKSYDYSISAKPTGEKDGLLTELVECVHEDWKTLPKEGQHDRVRLWFISDIDRLEIALPWAFQLIKYAWQDGKMQPAGVADLLTEANDFVLGALNTAFDFRTSNLGLYGLQEETLKHGILTSNYEGLPESWTSQRFLVDSLGRQSILAEDLVGKLWNATEEGSRTQEILSKVRNEQANLIDLRIRCANERTRWELAQDNDQLKFQATERQKMQQAENDKHITLLAENLNLPDVAMSLCEKHENLPTLAKILTHEFKEYYQCLNASGMEQDQLNQANIQIGQLRKKVNDLFAKFGTKWADAFFTLLIENDRMHELLDDFPQQMTYLKEVLRSKPKYAKVAWIQEILPEKDFDHAAVSLLTLGLNHEDDVWSKKIALSIGKLARLSSRSYSQENGILIPDGGKTELSATNDQLALIKIQEFVTEFVFEHLHSAVDEEAELQLAMEVFGNKALLAKQPAFSSLLHDSMKLLVNHIAMDGYSLMYLLTLIGDNNFDIDLRSIQFYFALQAVRQGVPDKNDASLLQQAVWRRCMLRDDWADINNTSLRNDSQMEDRVRSTALYMTFRHCLKKDLFDENTGITPISPADLVGLYTQELDSNLSALEVDAQETFIEDYQIEDASLQDLIQHCQLEKWYQGALDQAIREHGEEVAEANSQDVKAGKKEILVQAERSIADKEKKMADPEEQAPRAHPKKQHNSHARSLRSSNLQN